jgi:hypothetical protein
MSWVRSNRQLGSLLALFALSVQLVLSFGHVHLDGLRGETTSIIAVGTNAAGAPPSPVAPHPADEAGDYCAICAVLHLAATSFLPQAPHLPVRAASRAVEHVDRALVTVLTARRTAFQSRAPPQA